MDSLKCYKYFGESIFIFSDEAENSDEPEFPGLGLDFILFL